MTAEGWHRMLQITGAALGVPAAAVGTFAAYQSYFSIDVTCQKLRNDIIAIMERNIAPETKRSLLKKDVMECDKLCGEADPEARAIFQSIQPSFGGAELVCNILPFHIAKFTHSVLEFLFEGL